MAGGETPNNSKNVEKTPWDELALNSDGTRKAEYLATDKGQEEASIEDTFDQWTSELEDMVRNGQKTREEARREEEMMLDSAIEGIDRVRQEEYSRQQQQAPIEQLEKDMDQAYSEYMQEREKPPLSPMEQLEEDKDQAYHEYMQERGTASLSPTDELEKAMDDAYYDYYTEQFGAPEGSQNAKLDDEARAKLEAEERAKLEAEERAKMEARKREIEAEIARLEESEQDLDDIDRELRKNREVRDLGKRLKSLLPNLAELYAKNRRLIVGAKNRAQFIEAREEYGKVLDEYLRAKAEITYSNGMRKIGESLEANSDLAPDEYQKQYDKMVEQLETDVNVEFLKDYLGQQKELEAATIDRLDNGTKMRKFVSKVLNNKYLKGALVAAGVAGLAVTGVGLFAGLAAGTMTVGLGFTAGGVALGAGKGALSGAIMSRQDSKNSAVRGFANEDEIKRRIEKIDVTDQDSDTSNVASWLMEQYGQANTKDARSNRKRTAISAGIGAAIGGFMSGVHFNDVSQAVTTTQEQVGTTPVEYEVPQIDNVNLPQGAGSAETFAQMGGDPSRLEEALQAMYDVGPKYGFVGHANYVPGFDQAGSFAHAYPGPIKDWPEVAQSYITEVAEEWARRGLIPAVKTGGEPVFNTISQATIKYIPNAFRNILSRASAAVTAGAIGGVVGSIGRRRRPNFNQPVAPAPERTTPEQTPSAPERPPVAASASSAVPSVEATPASAGPTTEATPAAPTASESVPSAANYEAYRDVLGQEGINFLNSDIAMDTTSSAMFADWWNSLSDDGKRTAVSLANQPDQPGNPAGRAVKMWIRANAASVPPAPVA